jgi:hypothetical protein
VTKNRIGWLEAGGSTRRVLEGKDKSKPYAKSCERRDESMDNKTKTRDGAMVTTYRARELLEK